MNNNYCVIMGGGVGSRFWPLSKESRPKQFLDFFGTGKSLIQQTFDRFKQIVPVENIFISTNESYEKLILEQLPEIKGSQILTESARRNTAPCIAYASYHIRSIDPDANIVVTPADHLILQEADFLRNINTGLNFVRNHPSLVTLGVKPNRPETGYGYIQTKDSEIEDNIQKVKTFTEKPNLELAKVFFESGDFFWNSGIFIWNVKTIIEAFHKYLPDIATRFDKCMDKFNTPEEASFIKEQYATCENISIDYGLMEKADNVYMLLADFGWSDLGTWGSLFDLSPKDVNNNAALKGDAMFYDTKNSVLVLPKDKLAIIQGLDDFVVVDSENALLICKKSEEQRIKSFVTDVGLKFGGKYI